MCVRTIRPEASSHLYRYTAVGGRQAALRLLLLEGVKSCPQLATPFPDVSKSVSARAARTPNARESWARILCFGR